jgi:pimeloyl-ACP methyl ester carboxylesterase
VKRSVEVTRKINAPVDAIWSVLSNFCGTWHPAIDWIRQDRDSAGRTIRCFKVKGDDAIYRERLVSVSQSLRQMMYEHIEGIAGVQHYSAVIHVNVHGEVIWSAEIEADEPRLTQIADGTKAIFEMGLDALARLAASGTEFVAGEPNLAISKISNRPGPLLLFLHGIGGNRSNWKRQIAALEGLVQCAALDLRGYGDSRLGAAQSRVSDYCDDILRVMQHCGKQKVILCGLSYGSWIAASFAMRYPEKLAGLILSGGCTGMSEASAAEREAFLNARQKPLDAGKTPADFAANVVAVIASPNAGMDVRAELHAAMAGIPVATYRDAIWCFTHPEERFNFSLFDFPVLLMTGEFDQLATPAEIQDVALRIASESNSPEVRFEMIRKAGHVCNVEAPAIYNSHLTSFISTHIKLD